MTEPITEPEPDEQAPPPTPEPTQLELVAQLAAEAAVRARPDHGPRIEILEQQMQEILAALTAAAGPEGNGARLSARLEAAEQQLAELTARPPEPNPAQQKLIDDLRLKVATLERNK